VRKIIKTKWGLEIIFAQEDWFTGSFLEIGLNKKTPYRKAPFTCVYHILNGSVRVLLNGKLYEFSEGKTLLIREGTKYQLIGIKGVPRLIKIAKVRVENEDYSRAGKHI